MIVAAPGDTFETTCTGFATGLVGTIGYRILNNTGGTTTARTTAGIIEDPAGSGDYAASPTAPLVKGAYSVYWDDGSGVHSRDDLIVTSSSLTVPAPPSSPIYVSAASLKATLEMTGTTFADSDIDQAIQAACRGIDTLLDRKFYLDDVSNDEVRYYTPLRPSSVEIDDLVAVTEIASDYGWTGTYSHVWNTSPGGDMLLQPLNAPLEGRPWERVTVRFRPGSSYPLLFLPTNIASVRVTGRFGWATVPPQIVTFATILATKLLRRTREAPFGIVTVGSLDASSAMRLAKMDPDFELLARKFDRTPVLA